jgi:hypothetical protein
VDEFDLVAVRFSTASNAEAAQLLATHQSGKKNV